MNNYIINYTIKMKGSICIKAPSVIDAKLNFIDLLDDNKIELVNNSNYPIKIEDIEIIEED